MKISSRRLVLLGLVSAGLGLGGLAPAWAVSNPSQPILAIESNPVLQSILAESRVPGSAPEAYLLADKYRLDLSLVDLVDQVTLLTRDRADIAFRLSNAYTRSTSNPFMAWMGELEKILESDPVLKAKLDKEVRLQNYTASGAAIPPDYRMIDFKKIADNGHLARLNRYNDFAQDAEGSGLLLAFERTLHAPFFTKQLTVTKLKELSRRDLKKIRKDYYNALVDLYSKVDPASKFTYNAASGNFKAKRDDLRLRMPYKIFNILAALPNKYDVLVFISAEVPGIPYQNGLILLTPSFIAQNREAVETALKNYTRNQILNSMGDEYILGLRRWIKENRTEILTRIDEYNASAGTRFVLFYKDISKLPRRAEAIMDHEILLKIYKELPWMSPDHGLLFDAKGRERFVSLDPEHPHSHLFKRLIGELTQTETYVSALVGASALILTQGNLPVALSVQKIAKRGVSAIRYDQELKEFLNEIPSDVFNAFLAGTGFSAGRLYKVLALCAGRGAMQSFFTGQDVKAGAGVGMLYNLLTTYLVPRNIAHPMSDGFNDAALALNRRLELLEGAIRGGIQGGAVSLIEGKSVGRGAIKGAAYGTISTQLLIWIMGTRYNPFKDYDGISVEHQMELENQFQNEVGRGGTYAIDRQLILDANYRVGGILPDMISASITLPGNVAMSDNGFTRLSTLTHEASHLMQQEQSGVFGFYLFRYLPTAFKTGYGGHPDENFLRNAVGR